MKNKRCKTGARLFRKWKIKFESIPATNRPEWENVLFGSREYDKHAKNCKVCGKIKAPTEH